jgi:hypothetical protein
MASPVDDDLQVRRDIRKAYSLVGRLRGISPDDSVAVLHDHAAITGVSVHAAALAVLAEWHPVGGPRRRVPAAQGDTTTDRTGRIVLRWQSREKAYVSLSGVCSDDLAVRLQVVVERALRAGAIHLIVNTRRTTGVSPKLDAVIARTGRRLWARRGSLTLRHRAPDGGESDPDRSDVR